MGLLGLGLPCYKSVSCVIIVGTGWRHLVAVSCNGRSLTKVWTLIIPAFAGSAFKQLVFFWPLPARVKKINEPRLCILRKKSKSLTKCSSIHQFIALPHVCCYNNMGFNDKISALQYPGTWLLSPSVILNSKMTKFQLSVRVILFQNQKVTSIPWALDQEVCSGMDCNKALH